MSSFEGLKRSCGDIVSDPGMTPPRGSLILNNSGLAQGLTSAPVAD
jgi:hypothetical protein